MMGMGGVQWKGLPHLRHAGEGGSLHIQGVLVRVTDAQQNTQPLDQLVDLGVDVGLRRGREGGREGGREENRREGGGRKDS